MIGRLAVRSLTAHPVRSAVLATGFGVGVAVMAILLGISVPTAQHLKKSFESSTGVRNLINAALSNARAIAIRREGSADEIGSEIDDLEEFRLWLPQPSSDEQ